MDTLWIFRLDGSIQCDPEVPTVTLGEMRQELDSLIGRAHVVGMERRSLQMIRLCGMPTGSANAFEVTREAWERLESGSAGNPGYMTWPAESYRDDNPGPVEAQISTTGAALIGRPLRSYATGDVLTEDFQPERTNIEVDPEGLIVRVWFG